MKKSITLSEKVKNLTMLAGSVLASSFAANGQVIYTDVNPDKELGGTLPSSFPEVTYDSLDLNNDGSVDFKFTLNIQGTNPDVLGLSFIERLDGNFNVGYNEVIYHTLPGYHFFALKLDCADTLPGNFLGASYGNFAFQFGTSAVYDWQNVHDGYVGLKFKSDDGIHYGWIRLDVNTKDTIPNIVLKEYAYEATPNKKIAVCDTTFETGMNELVNLENAMNVFPNPSGGNCVIRINEAMQGEIDLSVRDESGREVFTTNLPAGDTKRELPLDLSQLSSGLYYIHLKSETNSTTVKWTKL